MAALQRYEVKELTDWLDGRYPADMAEHWDNVGLLVGDDEARCIMCFWHWILRRKRWMKQFLQEQT